MVGGTAAAVDAMNFVYFLQAGGGGQVKIGWSRNLPERLMALQAPSAVNVIRVIEGGRQTEAWLHRHFAEVRRIGEWFDFHPEMLQIVRRGDSRQQRY